MAINVQHGVPASPGLAGLASTAMRLRAASSAARSRGGGGGGGGRRSGGGRGGGGSSAAELEQRRAYNQESARRQEAEQDLRMEEKKAQLKEQGFDYEFTARQRQRIAQFNNAEQEIDSNPDFSEEEKLSMKRHLDLQRAGMAPKISPVDASQPQFPKGQDTFQSWENTSGGISTRKANGEEVELTEFAKTERGIERAAQTKQLEERAKWRRELMTEQVSGFSESGRPTKEVRSVAEITKFYRDERELEIEMNKIDQELEEKAARDAAVPPPFRDDASYQQWLQRNPSLGRQQGDQESGDWVQAGIAQGLDIRKEDIDLGSELGPLHAELRMLKNKGNLRGADAVRVNELIAILSEADPGAEISDFAVRESEALPQEKRLRKPALRDRQSAGMSFGVF